MAPIPETRYALGVDGGQIAYQVVGSGPIPMIGFDPLVTIDVMWAEPRFVRFLQRLASLAASRGSTPGGAGSSASFPRGERRVARALRMTWSRSWTRGARSGPRAGLDGAAALLFAATHPARTSALVVLDPSARFRGDDAYPGLDSGEIDRTLAPIEGQWGTGVLGRC